MRDTVFDLPVHGFTRNGIWPEATSKNVLEGCLHTELHRTTEFRKREQKVRTF